MNCAKHPESPVAAYCRTCGKALCESCKRDVRGVIYCEDCLATRLAGEKAGAAPAVVVTTGAGSPHPGLAGVLAGFFPFGVGQAYNGQYARGFVYLIVFIALVWATDHGGPADVIFGLGLAAFWFFQLIDAVRSASALRAGLPAPDPFGIDNLFGPGGRPAPQRGPQVTQIAPAPAQPTPASAFVQAAPAAEPQPAGTETVCCPPTSRAVPIGAVILIIVGVLFLVGNLGYMHFHWFGEFWPMILVAIGVWLLVDRWNLITSGTAQGRRHLMAPVVLLVLGGTFLAQSVRDVSFGRTWPLLLIAIGLVLIWQRVAPTRSSPPSGTEPSQAETPVEQKQER